MYNILKYNPIYQNLSYGLSFNYSWEVFNGIQESEEDYMHSGFGRTSDDVLRIVQHMAWLSRRMGDLEWAKNGLIQDFQNLLVCLPNVSTAKEYAERLIPYLISVGLIYEVGETIERYYYESQEKERLLSREALTFPAVYEKAGDNALLLQNDPETAFIYYHLAGLKWGARHDSDNRSVSQKRLEKEVDIYRDLLNCEIPRDKDWLRYSALIADSYAKSLDALKGAQIYDISTLDHLINQVEKISPNNRSLLRIGSLMVEGIRRKHALKIIFAVSQEKNRTDYAPYVMKWAKNLYDRRYRKLVDIVKAEEQDDSEKLSIVYAASEVAGLVDHILYFLRVDDPNTVAAYYTSYKTFSYMFPDQCSDYIGDCGKLSVMHLSYMNDPNEGKTIQKAVYGKTEKNSRRINPPYVFLKCFTSMKDYLPMWNMYADSAQGICIEIDTTGLDSLYHVCYVDDDNDIKAKYNTTFNYAIVKESVRKIRILAKKIERELMDDMLEPIRYLFKDKSYSYEQEIRIIYSFDRANARIRKTSQEPPKLMVVPDKPIQIKEVMLGPKFPNVPTYLPYIQEQMDRMAEITKTEVPDITFSGIDFR